MPETPDRFAVLVADPPWLFRDHMSQGEGKGASFKYDVLSLQEICAFELPPLLPDATLFLWRVAALQEDALQVMQTWGFTLKTELVWVKRTKLGKRWFGLGHTVRAEHEVCLIGTRGRPQTLNKSIRSTFEAAVGQHSEKPEEFFKIVEQLRSGPYVELFARKKREGWTCLGNEVPV